MLRTRSASAALPLASREASSSGAGSKYCSTAGLLRLLTTTMWSIPAPSASSITSCRVGVSPIGSSSLGTDFDAGRNRVPIPAAGMTALRTCMGQTIPKRLAPTRVSRPAAPGRAPGPAGNVGCDAHVRLPLRRLRRDHRGPAGLHGRPADRSGASEHGRGEAGQEGLHAGRRDVQGRRLLQDRQPRVVVAHGRRVELVVVRQRWQQQRWQLRQLGQRLDVVEQGVDDEQLVGLEWLIAHELVDVVQQGLTLPPVASPAPTSPVAHAIGRITMNPLARRPWLYWLGVGVIAVAVGLVAVRAAASVDEARRQWGTTRDVAVATSAL